MSNLLDSVVKYLNMGWSVIPLESRGKRPLISWISFQSSMANEDQINAWWKRWPDANIGVVTGRISKIIVLDVDGPKGESTLKEKKLHLPPTLVSKTGNGIHYFYRHPGWPVVNRASMLPGLDVRGDGGYVVAPPSVHLSGRMYSWADSCSPDEVEISAVPDWFSSLLQTNSSNPVVSEDWIKFLDGVEEGMRNYMAARLAGRFLAKGFAMSETIALLLLWNERNHPPLSKQEIIDVVRSIANREVRRILR